MNVIVVDYGMGNIGSVYRAVEECGANVLVTRNPDDIDKASKIILPGVGAFPDGMAALVDTGWDQALKKSVVENGKNILGICLGMQLLATVSHEGGETKGLDLISGEVQKLTPSDFDTRIPHVGWNEVNQHGNIQLMDGISQGTDYYFVHSYHFVPRDINHIVSTTPYCGGFVSAICSNSVYGVQFHPEKSSKAGFKLINNFLRV
ncbi:MAG: imidazole glycerol phosphate synthase subunit HisH [Methylophaga sp.]|nr:imidazole glycerol phosphate synthase subunit HisH [Methylophaga sp.]